MGFKLSIVLLLCVSFALGESAFGQAEQPIQNKTATERDAGISLVVQRKYSEAIEPLQKAVRTNDADAEAWFHLGLALLNTNKLKDAANAFKSALKAAPNYGRVHTALANCYIGIGKYSDAVRESNLAIAANNDDFEAHSAKAIGLLNQSKDEEALKSADIAVKIGPHFGTGHLARGQALLNLYLRFREDIPTLDAIKPSQKRGRAFEALKAKMLEASSAIEKYLELNPNESEMSEFRDLGKVLEYWARLMTPDNTPALGVVGTSQDNVIKAKIIEKPLPGYTNSARSAGVKGTVILKAVLSYDGKVRYILPIQTLPKGLTQLAMAAASRIKFIPATREGKPVSQWIQIEYNFNLF